MQDVTSQFSLPPCYCVPCNNRTVPPCSCVPCNNRTITGWRPANRVQENVLGLIYVLFRHVWAFWKKNGEKFQNDKYLGRHYDTGLPDCILSANQTWPPPLSLRYQEEDAHRPPLAGMTPLSSRRCGKQRFTCGTICSLFAIETGLRATSSLQ
jgi:hypothetical protein